MVPNLFFLFPICFFHPCLPVIFLEVLNIKGYNILEVGKFTIVDMMKRPLAKRVN